MSTVPFNQDRRPPLVQPDWSTAMEVALEIDDDARWKAADRGIRILDSHVSSVRVRVVVDSDAQILARDLIGRDAQLAVVDGDTRLFRGRKDGIHVEVLGPVSAR